MGRYYNGDISGKFWFGTQGSNAGEQFGAVEEEQNIVNYMIYNDDKYIAEKRLKEIEKELKKIAKESKELEELLKLNCDLNSLKNKKLMNDLIDSILINYKEDELKSKIYELLADWEMGKKIQEFFRLYPEENCQFEAEL